MIPRRDIHLDQLAAKLQENCVRRVIEPLLKGDGTGHLKRSDDLQYVKVLELLCIDGPIRIANPIYSAVIPREITSTAQEDMAQQLEWYIGPDGNLQIEKLPRSFQLFFREHSEHWIKRFQYREAGPQLLLQACLQRIVNGGGFIEREYGLGRKRTDLLIKWPQHQEGREMSKIVIECKLLHVSLDKTIKDGLVQTSVYMDRCNAGQGHLVIFDRSENKSWNEKIFQREENAGRNTITVWGM